MNTAFKVQFVYNEKGTYAPKEDLPFVKRENVALIVQYLDQLCFLSWNQTDYPNTLITGGIETGEDKEQSVKRELIEETGYYDIESIELINCVNISRFYAEHKNQNRESVYYPYLVTLKSLKQYRISEEEQKEHSLSWYLKESLDEIRLFDNHKQMINEALKTTISKKKEIKWSLN